MTAGRAQRLLPGFLAFACALPAAAAEEPPSTEIGLSHARETLSTHPNAWTDTQLELVRKFGPRKVLIGRVTSSERFGLHDDTLGLAAYLWLCVMLTLAALRAARDPERPWAAALACGADPLAR